MKTLKDLQSVNAVGDKIKTPQEQVKVFMEELNSTKDD